MLVYNSINMQINDKQINRWRREVGTKFKVEEGTSLNRKQMARSQVAMNGPSRTFSLDSGFTRF